MGLIEIGRLSDEPGWNAFRIDKILQDMVKEGIVWIDSQAGPKAEYWLPTSINI